MSHDLWLQACRSYYESMYSMLLVRSQLTIFWLWSLLCNIQISRYSKFWCIIKFLIDVIFLKPAEVVQLYQVAMQQLSALNVSKALEMFMEALQLFNQVYGPMHLDIANCYLYVCVMLTFETYSLSLIDKLLRYTTHWATQYQ